MQSQVDEVLSSRTRLKIEHLISIRPRTLAELADLTGISIQGVLKHLSKLRSMDLVEERSLGGGGTSVRKVYRAKSYLLGDYSTPELTVVKLSRRGRESPAEAAPKADLESMVEETMLMRRRVKEEVRRLGRLIDELVDGQVRLERAVRSVSVDEGERVVLEALFTEESMDAGLDLLAKYYGLKGGRRSIDRVLSKVNRSAGR